MLKFMIDSCVFIAALNPKDKFHNDGKEILEKILKKQTRHTLIINDYIIDETVTYLRKKASYDVSIKILDLLFNPNYFTLVKVTDYDLRQAYFIFKKYDKLSFTDAIIVATMYSNDIKRLISFDSDFRGIGKIELFNTLP